jgi:hypothetical protein
VVPKANPVSESVGDADPEPETVDPVVAAVSELTLLQALSTPPEAVAEVE